jgi:hypothetical protein
MSGMESNIEPKNNETDAQRNKSHFWTKWTAIEWLTAFLVIFTAIYSGVSIWLLVETRDAAEAAKQSASAAVAGVRPWLIVTDYTDLIHILSGADVQIQLTNQGKVPAYELVSTFEVRITKAFDLYEFKGCPKSVESIMNRQFLDSLPAGQSAHLFIRSMVPIDQERVDKGRKTEATVDAYVHGCVTYRDPVMPDKLRLTEMSFYMQVHLGQRSANDRVNAPPMLDGPNGVY